jgi:hypothetical protein
MSVPREVDNGGRDDDRLRCGRVRREVAARVQALTDLIPVEITVIVDDVFT